MADTIAESDRHLSWDVGPIRGTWKNRGSLYPHWNFGVHGRGVACVSYLNIDEDAHNTARIVFPYLPFPSPPPLFHLLIYTSAIFAISSIVLSSLPPPPPPLRYNDISPSTGTQVEYYHYTCRYPRTRVPVFTLNIYIYIYNSRAVPVLPRVIPRPTTANPPSPVIIQLPKHDCSILTFFTFLFRVASISNTNDERRVVVPERERERSRGLSIIWNPFFSRS